MLIKLYGPFNEKIGKSLLEFKIEGELPLSEFSKRLIEEFPIFRCYITGGKSFDILNAIFFIARKGIILGPKDIVNDDDEIEIMAPLDGG
jgi:molybdopterin converting factor small subunit